MDDSEIRSLPTPALLACTLELAREQAASAPPYTPKRESFDKRKRRSRETSELELCRLELYRRASEDTFTQAEVWAKSDIPIERELAALLFADLGEREVAKTNVGTGGWSSTFAARVAPILETMLNDQDPDVLSAVVSAFERSDKPLPVLKRPYVLNHDSADVKLVLALCLYKAINDGYEIVSCVQHLLRLMEDVDDDVRDWATFSLGTQCDADSEEIRAALVRRLGDDDEEIRHEAITGLARRVDDRVIPVIIEELRSDSVWRSVVEAAGIHGSSEFVEPLKELRPWWDVDEEVLEEAIRNCQGDRTENFDLERVGGWRSQKDSSDS